MYADIPRIFNWQLEKFILINIKKNIYIYFMFYKNLIYIFGRCEAFFSNKILNLEQYHFRDCLIILINFNYFHNSIYTMQ